MSKKNKITIERLCRLNGKSPTVRDRWRALYSMYRACRGHPMFMFDLEDTFRVFGCRGFVKLMNEFDPLASGLPVDLRKRMVDMQIKARKHCNTEKLLHAIMSEP